MVFCLPENKCVRVAHDTSEPGVNWPQVYHNIQRRWGDVCNLSVGVLPHLVVEILIPKELILERKVLEELRVMRMEILRMVLLSL